MDIKNSQENKNDILQSQNPIGQKLSHEAVFMTMSKKAEKISTGLYMVTDLIDSKDPIRKRIRECSIDLISETRSMSHAFSGDIYFTVARTISKSWELVSLIEVASSVGFISDMNARILRNVLVEFVASLRDKQRRESFSSVEDLKIGESMASEILLSKNLFNVKDDELDLYKGQKTDTPKGQNKNPVKDISPDLKSKEQETKKVKIKNVPRIEKEMKDKTNSEPIKPKKPTDIKPKKAERRELILSVIREKGEINVNDIFVSMPEISLKTIQRELNSLLEENVLHKVGEKRWSKYSLVS